jgi:hypothetical protein
MLWCEKQEGQAMKLEVKVISPTTVGSKEVMPQYPARRGSARRFLADCKPKSIVTYHLWALLMAKLSRSFETHTQF